MLQKAGVHGSQDAVAMALVETGSNYVELQLPRAKLHGLRAGVAFAIALYPNDPLVLDTLAQLQRGTRNF